ncbi:MAG TPA: ATP-dependent Clp protease ATP-binding subunit [Candidatus Avoscillospira avicola]|uniref:ATP-dependent Clp protease ATP-binding subunit n=1 Tax=Candidatus Avoscillospira avicola TaxID=2840706 RepID=A0A9D1DHD2_9FIRM|nr:ATP-dependent Clp protease ATP-binding subunit [Candidatus Avoscillospira avicola]
MHPTLCSKCKKNVAVIFVTKIEGGKTLTEGLCLKCAKEMGIKPVDDIMKRMGISEDELEGLNSEMTEAFQGMESMMAGDQNQDDDSDEIESQTATFPFLNKLFGGERQEDLPAETPGHARPSGDGEKHERGGKQKKHKFLDTYCLNLTQKARSGALDRVVGREVETERVIQILNRRQKNNPCLIGEPGVGKTAIAEGLAQRIAQKEVPFKLQDKEVYLLDLTALVAGTQFRGQFESRMKGLIEEVKKLGNIILVIDEVHNLVGAGDAEGSMNAANILKPALSRGEIQVIGATTFNEYRKYIEKDAALERRFQPVTVNEPTLEEAVDIIRGIAHYYESFHGVVISPEIARQAVVLSERYITDRFLPDKAIDLLDEACSDVNLKNKNISRLAELKKEHADLDLELSMLTERSDEADYARMAAIRSRNLQLDKEIAVLEEEPKPALTVENLARIIELWTKIPASKVKAQEYGQLRELESRLKKRIIGQDEAISQVAAAIRRGRVGISPKKRPISFIFVGPTGVGKTELVKCLADDLFDSVETLIRLDMSEYMEKHSVSKLIGSPPGYVGYDEAGQLTEKIRRKPYSVILFDELEKAHPDVLNILLQILDDGRITDAQGRTVNFENTVIIMTSNAGSDQKEASVGFGRSLTEQNKEKTMKALRAFLRPEFLNRVDAVVSFNSLTEDNFREIAGIMLRELQESLERRGIAFTWDDTLVDFLVKDAYSVTYGARNLRRSIQKHVEDPISEKIIDSFMEPLHAVQLSAQDGAVRLETQ